MKKNITEKIDPTDGLVTEIPSEKLNIIIPVVKKRPNGSIRYAQDFSNCVSMTEQHTSHQNDINYLIKRFQPDELGMYLAQKASMRRAIEGHDFSIEPTLQEAKNEVYKLQQTFEGLPENIKQQFPNALAFMKFLDNPANADKLIELKILNKEDITIKPAPVDVKPTSTTTTTPGGGGGNNGPT